MGDWEQFLDQVPWILEPGVKAAVGEPEPWSRGSIDDLPELSALLESTTLTPVSVGGVPYELLAWGPSEDRRGWLCHPPREADGDSIAPIHKSFWTLCGGIVERFGEPEPDAWWNDQDDVLTVDATRVPIADVLSDYAWIWEDDEFEVSINPDEYYAVAEGALENLTMAHRGDGRLLLFAPDYAFTGVTPLAGSPPHSLLTIDDVPDLATWIEVCAAAWR